MILLVHMLFGAAIGSVVQNIPLAIVLALLGHYFLDLFPHIEYLNGVENTIKKLKHGDWQKNVANIVKVMLDFFLGIFIIFLVSKNQSIIYLCALVGILPDGATAIYSLFPRSGNSTSQGTVLYLASQKFFATLNKILMWHHKIHGEKIHFLKHKKISKFWRITTQALALIISIAMLKF